MTSDEDRVVSLELALLDPAVRADAARLEALLHPEFVEVGASGRRWTRAEIIAELSAAATDDGAVPARDLTAHRVGSDTILLTFTTHRGGRDVHRSSLWVRVGGDWVVRFHQATPGAGV